MISQFADDPEVLLDEQDSRAEVLFYGSTDGDVLETEDGNLVVVELAAVEVLVIEISDISAEIALEAGHALGNLHWDLAVRGNEALFPIADSHDRTRATVTSLLPEDVPMHFERVPPTTFDDTGPNHVHAGADRAHQDTSHGHSHGDLRAYSDEHTDGDEHTHDGACSTEVDNE